MTVYKFRFNYIVGDGCHVRPFDKTIVNAPNEDEAWKTFLGFDDAKFGMPSSTMYHCEKIGTAYDFDGDVEEWKQAIKDGEVE